MTTPEDFLNSSSGESYDALKFTKVGDVAKGVIMSEPKVVVRPSLKDQTPEDQMPVNLDCSAVPGGELGPRTLWLRPGFLTGAISDAVREAGATGLQVGGTIAVKFTEERDTGKPNKAKVFVAKYEAPVSAGVNVDDIF